MFIALFFCGRSFWNVYEIPRDNRNRQNKNEKQQIKQQRENKKQRKKEQDEAFLQMQPFFLCLVARFCLVDFLPFSNHKSLQHKYIIKYETHNIIRIELL